MSDYLSDGDIVTIVGDDGEEFALEFIDEIDYNGKTYVCFFPADMDEDDPDYGLIILTSRIEDGEQYFDSVDDEAELDDVYNKFMVLLFDDEEDSEDVEGEN